MLFYKDNNFRFLFFLTVLLIAPVSGNAADSAPGTFSTWCNERWNLFTSDVGYYDKYFENLYEIL